MSTPSILLVSGSFVQPALYDTLITASVTHNISVLAPRLPSVGLPTGPSPGVPPTMYDDAALIASEITRLADEGGDVVVVAHSYGGIPATESIKGLSKDERAAQGKEGGVVRLAYMTAIVGDVGVSAAGAQAGMPDQGGLVIDVDVSSPPEPP